MPENPSPPLPNRAIAPLYVAVTFLSAFLLFQVELIMGKLLLPWFGGVAAVWVTCLFFFQTVLVLGYGYTHGTVRLDGRARFRLHAGLLGLSAVVLLAPALAGSAPLMPRLLRQLAGEQPMAGVLEVLAVSVGFPFLMLASTAPLLQEWFARGDGRSPYRLYAVSNFGSLAGLLSYPVLVEPRLRLSTQAWLWTGGYLLFAAGSVACGWMASRAAAPDSPAEDPAEAGREAPGRVALWIILPAVASSLLVSTTNFLTQDVAPVPLLWAVPLALYLVSFILAFSGDFIYRRWVVYPLTVVALAIACRELFHSGFVAMKIEVAVYSSVLLLGALLCHGEVARLRPARRRLTLFYLCLAVGGALGSAFAALLAPAFFPNIWEFHLSLGALAWVAWAVRWRDLRRVAVRVAALAVPVAFSVVLYRNATTAREPVLLRERSFYGVITVYERERDNALQHAYELDDGRILHGLQLRNPEFRHMATTYYGEESGGGMALQHHPRRWNADPAQRALRVGMVGLGTGTIAAYAQPGDYFRAYELNPQIPALSWGRDPFFTFVQDCRGSFEVVMGDARISLEREAGRGERQRFDVLVLDAFSGDAIPVHLLTREAFQLFLQHLRDAQSVIAVHITNQNVDLAPVVWRLAQEFKLHGLRVIAPERGEDIENTDWILLSRQKLELQMPPLTSDVQQYEWGRPGPLWTDDFSNLFRVLK